MIIMAETGPDCNVIRLLMGEETHMSCCINGVSLADLTPAINSFHPVPVLNKRLMLAVIQCGSEKEIAQYMSSMQEEGFTPGMLSNTPAPPAPVPPKQQYKTLSDLLTANAGNKSNAQRVKEHYQGKEVVIVTRGECSSCGKSSVRLVPDISVAICFECVKLDIQIAKGRRQKEQENGGEAI